MVIIIIIVILMLHRKQKAHTVLKSTHVNLSTTLIVHKG